MDVGRNVFVIGEPAPTGHASAAEVAQAIVIISSVLGYGLIALFQSLSNLSSHRSLFRQALKRRTSAAEAAAARRRGRRNSQRHRKQQQLSRIVEEEEAEHNHLIASGYGSRASQQASPYHPRRDIEPEASAGYALDEDGLDEDGLGEDGLGEEEDGFDEDAVGGDGVAHKSCVRRRRGSYDGQQDVFFAHDDCEARVHDPDSILTAGIDGGDGAGWGPESLQTPAGETPAWEDEDEDEDDYDLDSLKWYEVEDDEEDGEEVDLTRDDEDRPPAAGAYAPGTQGDAAHTLPPRVGQPELTLGGGKNHESPFNADVSLFETALLPTAAPHKRQQQQQQQQQPGPHAADADPLASSPVSTRTRILPTDFLAVGIRNEPPPRSPRAPPPGPAQRPEVGRVLSQQRVPSPPLCAQQMRTTTTTGDLGEVSPGATTAAPSSSGGSPMSPAPRVLPNSSFTSHSGSSPASATKLSNLALKLIGVQQGAPERPGGPPAYPPVTPTPQHTVPLAPGIRQISKITNFTTATTTGAPTAPGAGAAPNAPGGQSSPGGKRSAPGGAATHDHRATSIPVVSRQRLRQQKS